MKIEEKISLLKKTISEIKTISEKLDNDYVYEKKIAELNKEISRLKNRAEARGRKDEYRYDSLRKPVT